MNGRVRSIETIKGVPLTAALRVFSVVAGVCLLVLASFALAVRYLPLDSHLAVVAAVASPFLAVGAPIALVGLMWGRRWVLSGLAGALTVALVAVQLPSYVGIDPGTDTVRVRVMTINTFFGQADHRDIVSTAAEHADVLLVQELTPEAVRGLAMAGIDQTFPHQALDARAGAAGVGIYTRFPMTSSNRIVGYQMAMVSARLQIEGLPAVATVATVHFAAPWPQRLDGWQSDFERLPGTLAELADRAGHGAVVIGGDFNATMDMRPYRGLQLDGYRDAAEQAGAGRQFSYPSNRRIPPLMDIDHVLTRNGTAISTITITIAGSDHRALLATILIPRLS